MSSAMSTVDQRARAVIAAEYRWQYQPARAAAAMYRATDRPRQAATWAEDARAAARLIRTLHYTRTGRPA